MIEEVLNYLSKIPGSGVQHRQVFLIPVRDIDNVPTGRLLNVAKPGKMYDALTSATGRLPKYVIIY